MERQPNEIKQINPLQAYLAHYHLSALEVSIASQVRYLTVWNALHDKPIKPAHAALIRRGLKRLTGVHYIAPIAHLTDEPSKESNHA